MQSGLSRSSLGFFSSMIAILTLLAACVRPWGWKPGQVWVVSGNSTPTSLGPTLINTASIQSRPTARPPGIPILTPTPDIPHVLPTLRSKVDQYSVQPGDTLGIIANRYRVSIEMLIQANNLTNPNLLNVGQALTIPAPSPSSPGPGFKIIPDSELVFGPASAMFNVEAFVKDKSGFLSTYKEEVGEQSLTGAQIVAQIARDFSVNPRLLLAILERQSGWLTNSSPKENSRIFPIGLVDPQRKGLYLQLAWAANNLNRGYYLWRTRGASSWLLTDGSLVPISPTINGGTAAVQQLYAMLYDRANWQQAVSEKGLFAAYYNLFGYPFDYAIEPLLPVILTQPVMQLPFESGNAWAFTSGPHSAWGDGSAWAALDFAPPGDALGCVPSDAWVTSVADGKVTRAENGVVILDLDGDGFEQTGWVVLYLHIEGRERVQAGTLVKAGDRIGHPSCEGGFSTGTHVHLARRYNGEWISADQDLPFVLDGWVSSGAGVEYDGFLQRGAQSIEADAERSKNNIIQR
jgi:LasA protease